MKKVLAGFSVLLAASLFILNPFSANSEQPEGIVKQIISQSETSQNIEVEITNGENKGVKILVVNDDSFIANPPRYQRGDRVVLDQFSSGDFYISDYVRRGALTWLFAAFILTVVLITGWQGIGSLLGMIYSFLIIFQFILPQILEGASPVFTAILGAVLIIPVTFYLSHGIKRKTSIAIVGTIITLIITGLIATFFAELSNLTGLASEEVSFLSQGGKDSIDFRGLVLAGMIISILGILDDITISQSSIVQQLKSAKKTMPFKEIFARAMIVGRDHIASMVNTLILIYAGASLPLLLLLLDQSEPLLQVINNEFLAEEIVRTLVGSIGLILAVPITTVIAAFLADKNAKVEKHCHH